MDHLKVLLRILLIKIHGNEMQCEISKKSVTMNKKIGPRCVHVWLTSRFLTCNPVVVPLCKFGYNNI